MKIGTCIILLSFCSIHHAMGQSNRVAMEPGMRASLDTARLRAGLHLSDVKALRLYEIQLDYYNRIAWPAPYKNLPVRRSMLREADSLHLLKLETLLSGEEYKKYMDYRSQATERSRQVLLRGRALQDSVYRHSSGTTNITPSIR